MAVLAAAQLLDELMGRHRNVAPNEKVKSTDWEDPEFCKLYMVKFCPHDLFVNTRADLGPCSRTHDEEARKLFQEAKKTHFKKIQYQEDFVRFCTSMINDVEKKIIKGRQRLALTGKNVLATTNPQQAEKNQEKINILNERINELEKEAEEAGTSGNVEQAQGLMRLCDKLKDERDVLKRAELGHLNLTAQLAVEQEKQMEVCEVCGAFLIVGDAQQRIDDHLMGKQHMGYMKLKKALDEVSETIKGMKVVKNKYNRSDIKDRDRDKRREHSEHAVPERSRNRSRSEQGDREKRREDERKDNNGHNNIEHNNIQDMEMRDRKYRDNKEKERGERRHRFDRDERHSSRHHHHHSHRSHHH